MLSLTKSPLRTYRCLARYPSAELSATTARHDVRKILSSWPCRDITGDAELVTTELVANAVQHGGGTDVEMCVAMTEESVEISVTDSSASPPSAVTADDESEDGRGLLLVQALCADWGWETSCGTKRVWARLAV